MKVVNMYIESDYSLAIQKVKLLPLLNIFHVLKPQLFYLGYHKCMDSGLSLTRPYSSDHQWAAEWWLLMWIACLFTLETNMEDIVKGRQFYNLLNWILFLSASPPFWLYRAQKCLITALHICVIITCSCNNQERTFFPQLEHSPIFLGKR